MGFRLDGVLRLQKELRIDMDIEKKIIDILRNELSVRRFVNGSSIISSELGIFDGEFQDFLSIVQEKFNLKIPDPCVLPFSEQEATVSIIAKWVVMQLQDN